MRKAALDGLVDVRRSVLTLQGRSGAVGNGWDLYSTQFKVNITKKAFL